MNPPMVYDVTSPKIHRTTNTTAIVSSISILHEQWLPVRQCCGPRIASVRWRTYVTDPCVRQRPDFGTAPCANSVVDVLRLLQQPAWAPGLKDSISSKRESR